MHIVIPNSENREQLDQFFDEIEDWELVASGGGLIEEKFEEWDIWFYLGRTQDKKVYALRKVEFLNDYFFEGAGVDSIVAMASDVDTGNESEIVRGLLRSYHESGGRPIHYYFQKGRFELDEDVVSRKVSDIFPGAPESWMEYPACVNVEMILLEGNCIYSGFHDEFWREDFISAAETLFTTSEDGLFLVYRLDAKGIVPLFGWEVAWPLLRKGNTPPTKRQKVQGTLPSDYDSDPTLIEISQQPRGGFYGGYSIFLRVGGRTSKEAIDNWHQCARYLRKIRKAVILGVQP